ncbi:cytochrome c oxidase assembly protein (plasmid) [Peteryoungia desertarenae]|uniref:Cytochrome c oxidase assembly protein n=1 Tax=Peteryoungia desertarenae TaxID=1813451 RepID=A0ABX6QT27_9HYPH|nr:cytochrome c oxidase assembly protein [Peteryoungia desertarenae]QLF71623.1 cytochrome c oxidase assembly protein [Peteryoungia desertarenae]
MMSRNALLVFTLVAAPFPALAHSANHTGAVFWSLELLAVLPIMLAGTFYLVGLVRMRAWTGTLAAAGPIRVTLFAVGLSLAVVLLLSPLDRWAERFLSAHMVQHFGLMLVAAPLIALGRPGIVYLWALPQSWRQDFARFRSGKLGRATRALFTPVGAWLTYFLVLWLWHSPPLFARAVQHEAVHALQHLCFLGAALLFWTVVTESPRGEGRAAMLVVIFTTAVQSCALAALMTMSSIQWYPFYSEGPLGLSALEDQQLSGLIMWVPCCAIMIGAGVATMATLLRDIETRMQQARRR